MGGITMLDLKRSILRVLSDDALKPSKRAGTVPAPMKILLDVPFVDLKGQPITDKEDPEGFTLRSVLIRSALFVEQGHNPEAKDKFKAYQLAMKINAVPAGGSANFSTEDLATLKANAGKMWMPLVVGITWTHLDAHENPYSLPVPGMLSAPAPP
jgi:hypothetical protein